MAQIRESYLTCCEIVSPFSGFKNWRESELEALFAADTQKIGEIILARLDVGKCGVTDAYASVFDGGNVRFVAKFAASNGVKMSHVASLAGVDVPCIRKAISGRYSFRGLLSRFVGVSKDGEFLYDPKDVVTLRGRDYQECFADYSCDWLRGCEKRVVETIGYNRDELLSVVDCINKNDVLYYCDLSDYVLTHKPELFSVVVTHSSWLQAYLKSREKKIAG